MNNVFTAIAFRAPCAVRQLRRQPLLQLFNSYGRSLSSKNGGPMTSRSLSPPLIPAQNTRSNEFTTSAILTATGKPQKSTSKSPKSMKSTKSKPAPPKSKAPESTRSESKTETPPTVTSHTEGLPAEEDQLTWRDYDPAGGMPLPQGELPQPKIDDIFDSEELDADQGNYILNVMYWRRQSGALIDSGLEFPKSNGVTREQALKGLEYVRSLDPEFDEGNAGRVWAGEEELRLQEQLRERAVRLKLYKPEEAEEEPEEEEEEEGDQGTKEGRDRNKESQLIKIREENIARQEREEAEAERKKNAEELLAFHRHRGPLELGGGVQPPTGVVAYTPQGLTIRPEGNSGWLQPVTERADWVKKYEKQAEIIESFDSEGKAADLSLLQRLGPSFLLMLSILALAYWISENYTPPPKAARILPDTPPAVATVGAVIGALAVAFIANRFPPLWRTFNKYCTVLPAYPYALSIIGNTLRHQPLRHLLSNSASLFVFGLMLHEDVGRGTFLAIFFSSAATGGFATLAYNVLAKNWAAYIFGSSIGVLGVLASACVLRPNGTLKIGGYEVPLATWAFLAVYGVAEAFFLIAGRRANVDHVGHLGGIGMGIAWGVYLKWKADREGSGVGEKEPVTEAARAEEKESVVRVKD